MVQNAQVMKGDLPHTAIEAAAHAIAKGYLVGDGPYTMTGSEWGLARIVLEAAAPHISAAKRDALTEKAWARREELANAAQAKAVEHAVTAERKRIAELAVSNAVRIARVGGALGRIGEDVLRDFADLIRDQP